MQIHDSRWISVPIFVIPIIIGWHVNVIDWKWIVDYSTTMLVIITVIMALFVAIQIKHIKYETTQKTKYISISVISEHYTNRFIKYRNLISKISNKKYRNEEFTSDEIYHMEFLLNEFEILAIKVFHMKMDVGLVNEITGNIIISVMDNNEINNVIEAKQKEDSKNYERITELYFKIKKVN